MKLFGRTQIFTDVEEITSDNIVQVVDRATSVHNKNRSEITFLYNYYKGKQSILSRHKDIRPEICNIITENWANAIVSFYVGYLCGSPIQYVSSRADETVSKEISKLNQWLESEGKETKDHDLFEWQMIAGTSYRMTEPDSMYDRESDECPFEIYTLDPRDCFVIYNSHYHKKPVAGVILTYYSDLVNGELVRYKRYSVYTDDKFYEIKEGKIVKEEWHPMGMIPLIEYPANNARLGRFEIVISLLDAINALDSNRLDGVEQFIQSLMVVYNATIPDENANSIREKGYIELKSVGDAKADIKILSEQLNQSETQTLKNDLIQRVREIVGLPAQGDGTTGDSSNNGAALLKGGWENAETRAKETVSKFNESEQRFLRLIISLCNDMPKESLNLKVGDILIRFPRWKYDNLLVKSQVLTTMLSQEKIAPKLAFQSCGLFIDAEEAYRESMEYYDRRTEQPDNGVPEGVSGVPEKPEESE